jgi:phage shock protein A
MSEERRRGPRWFVWLLAGFVALLAVPFALHAVTRVIDLVSTVVVLGVVGIVGWRVASRSGRRAQPTPVNKADEPGPMNQAERKGGTKMWQSLKRWWKYLAVKLRVVHEERADPKVQLEQAILEARAEHRRLSDAAALVVAQQKQAQDRLDAKVAQCDKAKASAGQALLMIDRETRLGNSDKVATFTTAAEGLANKVLGLEGELHELDDALLQSTRAAEQAKAAVVQNSTSLQAKLDEQERLLSVLDRAKMQEAMNDARGQLEQVLDRDVPTFAEVERKIQTRHAVAEAKGELTALQATSQVDPALLAIEAAERSAEAQALLVQMRAQLGLAAPDDGPRMLER